MKQKEMLLRWPNTPNLDKLFATCPYTLIEASGRAVGLPDGQMGNSEVGHINIGAGRIVDQELMRITRTMKTASFSKIKFLLKQSKMQKRIILRCTHMDLFPRVAYIHIQITWLLLLKWQKEWGLTEYIFIALWMEEMFLRQVAKVI